MNEEQPRVIYIRAGTSTTDQGDLAGLIGRIMREAISSNNQCFVLQLAHDQRVLNTPQAWKTLKQITTKQGMALVVSGGSNEVREIANSVGFPIVGTAELETAPPSAEIDTIRARVLGYSVSREMGGLSFEQLADEYRSTENNPTARTVGAFIEFVRLSRTKKEELEEELLDPVL